ncbi:MAG: WD40 repeat domain-containing protein [Candidatus Thorarchaeota archaeon]
MDEQELSLFLKPVILKPEAEHGSEITRRFAMNNVGRMIAAAMQDRSIRLYDVRNCEEMQRMQDEFLCTSLAFSPKGDIVASGGVDRVVKLWDIRTGTQIATLEGHTYPILSLSFSPDGTGLVSASGDTTLITWDVDNHQKLHQMKGHSLYVVSCDWSPTENLIVSASVDATIILWNSETGELKKQVEEHRTAVQSVRFSPDGTNLVSGSSDQTMKVWEVSENNLELDRTLRGHSGEVRALAYSSDGRFIASGSGQKEIFVWSAETYKIEGESRTHAEIDGLDWIPNQNSFVTCDGTGAIIQWDVEELVEMLHPFEELLKDIESDTENTRREELVQKFEAVQSQYSEEVLKDKRVFYIMWQCKKALRLLKGTVRK